MTRLPGTPGARSAALSRRTFAGSLRGTKCPASKGRVSDLGAGVPFVVRAPWLTPGGRVSTELADFTGVRGTRRASGGVVRDRAVYWVACLVRPTGSSV